MVKQIGRIIFFIIIFSLATIVQLSLWPALPPFFHQFNLALIIVVFALFFAGLRPALAAALVCGFWLDIFSFQFFGLNILSLGLAAVIADFISLRWLTNRSLYSFLFLMLIASASQSLLLGFSSYFFAAESGAFFLFLGSFWTALLSQLAWTGTVALLTFNLVGAATRRLQPFFLENK